MDAGYARSASDIDLLSGLEQVLFSAAVERDLT
jgi:hypothetical protein